MVIFTRSDQPPIFSFRGYGEKRYSKGHFRIDSSMSGENPGEYWSSQDRHQENEVSGHLALVMTQAKRFPKIFEEGKACKQSIVSFVVVLVFDL
ncbi:MAG: hypothetical protein QOI53_2083 [Verrucomicrobiota bacterium]|nr:hypothetical protein [Verrucomicrobiota bacterium]